MDKKQFGSLKRKLVTKYKNYIDTEVDVIIEFNSRLRKTIWQGSFIGKKLRIEINEKWFIQNWPDEYYSNAIIDALSRQIEGSKKNFKDHMGYTSDRWKDEWHKEWQENSIKKYEYECPVCEKYKLKTTRRTRDHYHGKCFSNGDNIKYYRLVSILIDGKWKELKPTLDKIDKALEMCKMKENYYAVGEIKKIRDKFAYTGKIGRNTLNKINKWYKDAKNWKT